MCLDPVEFVLSSIPLAFTLFLTPLPQCLPSPEMKAFDGSIPFKALCYNVSHSLHSLAVDLCVCSHLPSEEVFLMMAKQGTDLLV